MCRWAEEEKTTVFPSRLFRQKEQRLSKRKEHCWCANPSIFLLFLSPVMPLQETSSIANGRLFLCCSCSSSAPEKKKRTHAPAARVGFFPCLNQKIQRLVFSSPNSRSSPATVAVRVAWVGSAGMSRSGTEGGGRVFASQELLVAPNIDTHAHTPFAW